MSYTPTYHSKATLKAVAKMELKPGTYHGRLNGICTVIIVRRKIKGVERTPEIITDYARMSSAIRGAKRAAEREPKKERMVYRGRFDV
jgi:hypothetical protein